MESYILAMEPRTTSIGELMYSTVGSTKRLLYFQNLASSGPEELRITAYRALQCLNTALTAAVCMRIEMLPYKVREELGFTRVSLANDLAEAMQEWEWERKRAETGRGL